jgi:hypothetical protein
MQQSELVLACDTTHVGKQPELKIRRNDAPAFFRTKNTMKELADVGVCHIVFSVVPDGTSSSFQCHPPMNRWAILDRPYRDGLCRKFIGNPPTS